MNYRLEQLARLAACLIFAVAIGSAEARPTAPKTSFGSFSKSSKSTNTSNTSSAAPAHVAPVALDAPSKSAAPPTSFGSFKSSPVPTNAPVTPALAPAPASVPALAVPVQATKSVAPQSDKMAADMQASAAKANAIKTFDQRNAVTTSPLAAAGSGTGVQAPAYVQTQPQLIQRPSVVYQNSPGIGSGLGSMFTGFMLGRMLSPSHSYSSGANMGYPANASSNEQRTDWDSGNAHQSYFPWGLFILLAVFVGIAVYFWRKRSAGAQKEVKSMRYTL